MTTKGPGPKKPRKKQRTMYTDHRKKQAVARAFKENNIADVADSVGVVHSVLRSWCRDPRFGGKPGAFAAVAAANGLPTKRKSYSRSRQLVATSFACPHCGGPISKGA